MGKGFQIVENFKLEKTAKNKSIFNVFKHMLMQKKVTNSILKNFFIMIYFMYYRISLEFGLVELSIPETIIVNSILLLILFSLLNQGSRFIYSILKVLYNFTVEMIWIYKNLDKIRKILHHQ